MNGGCRHSAATEGIEAAGAPYIQGVAGPQPLGERKGSFDPVDDKSVARPSSIYEEPRGGFKGVILSGGPSSVYEENAPLPPKRLFEVGVPVLGIGYGMQAMGLPGGPGPIHGARSV
jgi:hypothetical protein